MKCLNKFCVFQKNNVCTCEKVQIDWRGCCESMVNIRLTQSVLEESKFFTKLILNRNDNYSFDYEKGEFIYIEDKNL